MAVNTLGQDITQAGGSIVPVAQTPVSPVPQIQTPAVNPAQNQALTTPQTPATVVNVNQPAPAEPPKQAEPKTQPVGTSLTPPANGSVVDLLNSAGQDSSLAAREQLAQKYGIQGYTGTAAQNQDLSKKFIDAFNANKGSAVPQNSAAASSALDSYFTNNQQQQPQQDPTKSFFDQYSGMNPVVKSLYDNLNNLLSSTGTQQTLVDEYNQLRTSSGLEDLQTKYMNLNRVMSGTEDDIRDEITNTGGLATESQVQALTSARNKTLLKQSNALADQIKLKNDYIDQIVGLTKADREAINTELTQKLGIADKVITLQNNMDTAARTNYNKIVDTAGYQGLAEMVKGNPQAQGQVEQLLALPKGALSNQSWLDAFGSPKTSNMTASIQEYEYAKKQGYSGTFNQYQNEDANRKAKVAGAGAAGLTAAQINQTVNQIANNFDNEQLVKDYNQASNALRSIQTIGTDTKSPTDDMAFIYSFAKIMDPNSVVREGEYKTVQDYAQALVDKVGLNIKRVTDNSNFLTKDAKDKMLTTLSTKVGAMKQGYDQVSNEYQRQIDDAYAGKPRQITNYATTVGSDDKQITSLKSKLQPGEILVARETPTGRKYTAIMPDELWATDITF